MYIPDATLANTVTMVSPGRTLANHKYIVNTRTNICEEECVDAVSPTRALAKKTTGPKSVGGASLGHPLGTSTVLTCWLVLDAYVYGDGYQHC